MANFFGIFYNKAFSKSLRIRNDEATLLDIEELLKNNTIQTPDDIWQLLEKTPGTPCPDSVLDSDGWIAREPSRAVYRFDYGLPDDWEILTDHRACRIAAMSIKDIAKAAGISQRALARQYSIPYRTMEDWSTKGTAPLYIKLMLIECLGLKKIH